jgi:hypothetical protein
VAIFDPAGAIVGLAVLVAWHPPQLSASRQDANGDPLKIVAHILANAYLPAEDERAVVIAEDGCYLEVK